MSFEVSKKLRRNEILRNETEEVDQAQKLIEQRVMVQ